MKIYGTSFNNKCIGLLSYTEKQNKECITYNCSSRQSRGSKICILRDYLFTDMTSSLSSPVALAKKNYNNYRFYVDCRKLNSVTKINARPMSHMDSILRKL